MYNLKDKIKVTEEFLNDLIAKSWQETEAIQQQIANIDTSTALGAEVARLLKNTCTNNYVLIGCLESLIESPTVGCMDKETPLAVEPIQKTTAPAVHDAQDRQKPEPEEPQAVTSDQIDDFEPFEYFVDFDEPSGDPLSDKDLYNI